MTLATFFARKKCSAYAKAQTNVGESFSASANRGEIVEAVGVVLSAFVGLALVLFDSVNPPVGGVGD